MTRAPDLESQHVHHLASTTSPSLTPWLASNLNRNSTASRIRSQLAGFGRSASASYPKDVARR